MRVPTSQTCRPRRGVGRSNLMFRESILCRLCNGLVCVGAFQGTMEQCFSITAARRRTGPKPRVLCPFSPASSRHTTPAEGVPGFVTSGRYRLGVTTPFGGDATTVAGASALAAELGVRRASMRRSHDVHQLLFGGHAGQEPSGQLRPAAAQRAMGRQLRRMLARKKVAASAASFAKDAKLIGGNVTDRRHSGLISQGARALQARLTT
jgi:hypothetical protein